MLAGAHGHPHVEQRRLPPRPPHVTRPAAHPDDAQGLRVPAAATRPLLPLPAGTLPQRNAAKGERKYPQPRVVSLRNYLHLLIKSLSQKSKT